MGSFEDQLWTELTHAHGDELAAATRPPARRGRGRPIALTAGAFGVVGVATAVSLALTATTSTPAYAVTENDDGTVAVTIHELVGVTGANAELARLGVPVRAVPVTPTCREKFYPVPLRSPFDIGTTVHSDEVTVRRAQIPAGDTLLLNAEQVRGGLMLKLVLAHGPLPDCFGPILADVAPGTAISEPSR